MRRLMTPSPSKFPGHVILAALGHLVKWICLPAAFGLLAHATILLVLQITTLIPHPLAALIGIIGTILLAHIFLVVTHEAGHWAGARIGGMCVYKAAVGPVEFLRDANTWRMRTVWPRGPAKRALTAMLGGTIYACADPNRDSARQHLWMLAGGPAANLFCAAVLLSVAQAVSDDDVRQLVQAFAYLNFATSLVNLVPSAMPYVSDGHQIRNWIVGPDQNDAGLILNRLAGMSMHGLPEPQHLRKEIAKLAGLQQPMPLVYLFFEMKELQFIGAWHAVSNLSGALDEQLVAMGPEHAAGMAELIAMFRCEIAFSRAIANGMTDVRLDDDIGADVDWSMPCLRPRCLALDAALRGAPEEADRLLRMARALSMQSLDYSLRASEDFMQRIIFERFVRPSYKQ